MLSQVKACNTVRSARVNKEYHPGDLLYSAVVSPDCLHASRASELNHADLHQVHCIVQIVGIVIRRNKTLPPDATVDLRFPMRSTGAWKPDAQLQTVVDLSIEVLGVYRDEDLTRSDLVLRVLEDFEVVWLEVLNPILETEFELHRLFAGGGFLRRSLLGPELYEKMTGIRSRIKRDRCQQVGQHMEDSGEISIAIDGF